MAHHDSNLPGRRILIEIDASLATKLETLRATLGVDTIEDAARVALVLGLTERGPTVPPSLAEPPSEALVRRLTARHPSAGARYFRAPGSRTVLVVDDDEGIREGLVSLLDDAGLTVVTAANGREALDYLSRTRPSVVLLDLRMPGMDGWTVLAEIRKNAPTMDLPVIVMTAADPAAIAPVDSTVSAYFLKPLDCDQLLTVVQGCVTAT